MREETMTAKELTRPAPPDGQAGLGVVASGQGAPAPQPRVRVLKVMYDTYPTHRPDVAVLFGNYLPRHGISSDIVTMATEVGTAGTPGRAGAHSSAAGGAAV
jgi:hypothetical protein